MDHPLKVDFGTPHAGWLRMSVTSGDQRFEDHVSYTPNDVLHELASALSLALQGGDGTAIAHCEPITYEFRFTRSEQHVRLDLVEFPDWNRLQRKACLVLSVEGDVQAIALPFWRALRRLETQFDEASGWHDFPALLVERVTALVDSFPNP